MMAPANGVRSLIVFLIDGRRYALPLLSVERIVRAAAVTPVPETPPFVLGLISIGGCVMSVVSLRRCLGLAERDILPEDQFVVTHTSRMAVALVVDVVQGLSEIEGARAVVPGDVLPGQGSRVRCMARIDDDIVLIYDLDTLFSMDDQERMLACQELALGGKGIFSEKR